MVVYSRGFAPQNPPTKEEQEQEKRFFLENLPVILKHQKAVLESPKFFSPGPAPSLSAVGRISLATVLSIQDIYC